MPVDSPQRFRRNDLNEAGFPRFPVHTLDGIRENHSCGSAAGRNWHLEWIALHLIGNGYHYGETNLVVGCGRQNQGGTPSCLLVSQLRIEIDFDDVSPIGNISGRYHTSLPTGPPQSCSSCRFSRVICLTSASRVGWRINGSNQMEPSSTLISSSSPSRRLASRSMFFGMRTA